MLIREAVHRGDRKTKDFHKKIIKVFAYIKKRRLLCVRPKNLRLVNSIFEVIQV